MPISVVKALQASAASPTLVRTYVLLVLWLERKKLRKKEAIRLGFLVGAVAGNGMRKEANERLKSGDYTQHLSRPPSSASPSPSSSPFLEDGCQLRKTEDEQKAAYRGHWLSSYSSPVYERSWRYGTRQRKCPKLD